MTPHQRECLRAIKDLTIDGVCPTYEQIRVHLGLASKSGVNRMIVALERQGHLRRTFGCRQTLQVVEPVNTFASIERMLPVLSNDELLTLSYRAKDLVRARAEKAAA